MHPRRLCLVLLLTLVFTAAVFGYDHLAVPLSDPAYDLVRIGEIRGVLTRLSAVRPFTTAQIRGYLEEMLEAGDAFTEQERGVISHHLSTMPGAPLDDEVDLQLVPDAGALVHAAPDGRMVSAGLELASINVLDFTNVEAFHTNNILDFVVEGTLFPFLSFAGNLGFSFDQPNPAAFAPYGFSKTWDRFHMRAEIRNTDIQGSLFSMVLGTDLAFSFLENDLLLRFSRFRRDWGHGFGNLSLSDTARPFLGVEAAVRLAPWLGISHVTGSLTNASEDFGGIATSNPAVPATRPVTNFKHYTIQRLELFPFDWLYVAATGSVVWAKYFELGYLSPLISAMIYQNVIGDLDNAGIEVSGAITIAPWVRLYGNFFADEMEITTFDLLFSRPRNMFAFQLGLEASLPFLPFTTLAAQYTKIEPFVYSHYDTGYPNYFALVDTTYRNDGENLGYRLPPNSDEWFVRLETLAIPGLTAGLEWRLIRHGTNDPDIVGAIAIFGDADISMDYNQLGSYPDKNFLFDGFYDWNNLVTIDGAYRFAEVPISIAGSYTIAHTFYRANNSGIPEPAPVTRHIMGLSVSVWH